jgi:hypothetical protein
VKDATKDDYLHVGLAPSYGTLDKESIKMLDDNLKVMIAGTMRALESRQKQGPLSWDDVMSVVMQNSLLELADDGEVNRADKLIKEGTNVFKFDGSPDAAIVKEVSGAAADDMII